MPIYEYFCTRCETSFETLRSMSQADSAADCPRCASPNARRKISRFAAVSKSNGGDSHLVASSSPGGGGCGSCSGGHCGGCGH